MSVLQKNSSLIFFASPSRCLSIEQVMTHSNAALKGDELSLNSASHGSGRAMSRADATQRFTMSAIRSQLRQRSVTLIGGSVEECSDAYKDIETVMSYQSTMIEVQGKFMPRIVRMNDK